MWDEENRSEEEESVNVCFMAIDNEVFYTPSDIFSCDEFEDDHHKRLSNMYEELKKVSIKNKDLKSNFHSLLK